MRASRHAFDIVYMRQIKYYQAREAVLGQRTRRASHDRYMSLNIFGQLYISARMYAYNTHTYIYILRALWSPESTEVRSAAE